MAKKYVVGTITGVFDGALDGVAARLVRRRKFGYTVELIESKHSFQKGDIVHLSPGEFLLQNNDTLDFTLRTEHTHASTRQ